MFDSLSNKLQDTFQAIRGEKRITENNIEGAISQVRRALLESDVSLKAVKLFTTRVKEKALGEEVLRGVKPDEQFVKIINDALTEILGGDKSDLDLSEPGSLLLLGLQGAGKTTASAKLALRLKKEGKKPLLVPCDLQRPAAIQQLRILAKEAEVDFLDFEPSIPATNVSKGLEEGDADASAQASSQDENLPRVKSLSELIKLTRQYVEDHDIHTVIYDTAGRLQVDTDLMAELLLLEKAIQPREKLLVIDSLIGQEAVNVADTFNTQIGITGIILTKLDGDSKGGAALSVVEATQKPIKLASVGEKLDDLEPFYPERIASRVLGMGDVVSLVEKAQEQIEEEEAKKLEEQLLKGNFNYETFLASQNMLKKLGNFTSIFKMMGMGGMLKQMGLGADDQENLMEQGEIKQKKYRAAINSMTKQERTQPKLMTENSRKKRIAKGCGLSDADVNSLVSEFNQMSKFFGQMGPMLSMMQAGQGGGANALAGAPAAGDTAQAGGGGFQMPSNPMDMLGNMLSGKQKRAMKQAGMSLPGMPSGGGAPKQKIKKGEKPKIKGFGKR